MPKREMIEPSKGDKRYVRGNHRQGFGGSHVRYPLNADVPNPPEATSFEGKSSEVMGCRFHSRASAAAVSLRESLVLCRMGGPSKAGSCFPCQRVKTRAIRAAFRP